MQPLIFVYDNLEQDIKKRRNGKHTSVISDYHLTIPEICEFNGIPVVIEHKTNIDKIENFYYTICFSSIENALAKNKSILDIIDSVILKAFIQKKCKIILSNNQEYLPNSKQDIKKLKQHLQKIGFNDLNTIIVGCNHEKKVKNFLTFNYFETVTRHVYCTQLQETIKFAYQQRQYNIDNFNIFKRFLCLNRIPRTHRIVFLYLCWKNNLLTNMSCSLTKKTSLDYNNILQKELKDDINEFNKQLPLTVDNVNTDTNLWNENNYSFLIKNGIYIVTETLFVTDLNARGIYFTEKTFKPIMYKMPFICVSEPYALKYLRNLGYMTFSSLWDESYDVEDDPIKRIHKIVDLVEQLNALDEVEFYNILKKANDITHYNLQIFLKRKPEKILIDTLMY